MNKFFKFLSGRPKSGDIRECIKPFVFYPQIIFSVACMYGGMIVYSKSHFEALMWAICSVVMAWQSGWGMSIERFINSEKEED